MLLMKKNNWPWKCLSTGTKSLIFWSDLDIICAWTGVKLAARSSSSNSNQWFQTSNTASRKPSVFVFLTTVGLCNTSLWMCLVSAISPRSWIGAWDTCQTTLPTVYTVMSVGPSLRKINFSSLLFSVPICCCKYKLLTWVWFETRITIWN